MSLNNELALKENYYDFRDAEEFLQSISNVTSISPNSYNDSMSQVLDQKSSWSGTDDAEVDDFFLSSNNGIPDDNVSLVNQEHMYNTGISAYNVDQEAPIQQLVNANFENSFGGDIQSLAMSSGTDSQTSGHSTASHPSLSSASTSPEPALKDEINDVKTGLSARTKGAKVSKAPRKEKSNHNVIEKKYRTNINSKILALRDAVPSLRIASGSKDVTVADLEGLRPASKLNKASVLTKATEYIKHLEAKNRTLKQQNEELRRMIQETSVRPLESQNPGTFGFIPTPNQQSYYSTMMAPQYNESNSNALSYTENAPTNQRYNKYLLGSLATVMGTSLIGGDSEFRVLSVVPLPSFILDTIKHPSPLAVKMWSMLKIALVLGTFLNFALLHLMKLPSKPIQRNSHWSSWLSWTLVSFGLRPPMKISNDSKDIILKKLLGRDSTNCSWLELFKSYIYLASCEADFETCFLQLIIGTILTRLFPASRFIFLYNMNLKGSLLLQLEYKGDNKSLSRLKKLISEIDGLSMLGSPLITRALNLSQGHVINLNTRNAPNNLRFVEILLDNGDDYYGLIIGWRILEIIDDLNMSYLRTITGCNENDDSDTDEVSQIMEDIETIDLFLIDENDRTLNRYFNLFKTVMKPNKNAIGSMKALEDDILEKIDNFELAIEPANYSDDKDFVDSDKSDSSITSQATQIENTKAEQSHSCDVRAYSKLIRSLNWVDKEQYLIVVCALVIYYQGDSEANMTSLLQQLSFVDEKIQLSVLSFTSILGVIKEKIRNDFDSSDEQIEVLDRLIRTVRLWINDNKISFMEHDLSGDLADYIVSKGKQLNEMKTNDNEDDEHLER